MELSELSAARVPHGSSFTRGQVARSKGPKDVSAEREAISYTKTSTRDERGLLWMPGEIGRRGAGVVGDV
jgi:hypothetical protein